ncbi:ATP-binding cassette domain-containing protein [Streptomyces sudanensis]|uniref:ABC transporter ATP-binding protein n=1 Tax=Streptomyces sudanensis TaxID=436397 RepID=UPI0020CFA4B3|nr:ATP-binding cassette domain-containing protein [Streptomyces sudanensis]MCP9987984.1 ATP-binding cassette domain-containing protein [Streptomyces sudanensis]
MPLHYDACTFGYRYRSRPVLDGLTLRMPPGHTVLLGPNGAGKSTLLSLGASAVRPGSGRVLYRGLDPAVRRQRGPYRRAVAWLPQKPDFLPGMTCHEHVAYAGWLKGMSEKAAWRAAPQALERVGLDDRARHRIDRLSGGQQQRVAIAQALVHRAEVLLLDEPTVGLDPRQRETFLSVLNDLRGSVHVVLSTHDVADLDTAFDHVAVLSEGRVRFSGTMDEFTAHAEPGCAPGRHLTSAYISLTGGAAC